MREIRTSGSVGAVGGNPRGDPTAGAVLQGGRPLAVRSEHLLLEMNHDLEALPSGSRHRMACQERLGEHDRAIGPGWPRRFRGKCARQSLGKEDAM